MGELNVAVACLEGMGTTIYERFQQIVHEVPDRVAIVDKAGQLTYDELDNLVNDIVSGMPDVTHRRVGIVMDHGALQIASMLAVLARGGAYVPAEPSLPHERICMIMEEADVEFIFTSPAYERSLRRFGTLTLPHRLFDNTCETGAIISAANASPADPAYILYTSGTTGRPKGVVVSNGNVCHYARAFHEEFHNGPGDIMAQLSVCTFDIFVEEVFATLLNGATLAIANPTIIDNVSKLLRWVEEHKVTMISGFPYLLRDINPHALELPASVRLLISGGDVLRQSYVSNLVGRPGLEVYNTYGPSETTVCASYQQCTPTNHLPDGTYPIGHSVKGAELSLSPEGEILISGDGVSLGYLTDIPDNANFVTNADGTRTYHSGDIGYMLPDGSLGFTGRRDEQVMILGKRVEAAEVESCLCNCDEVEQGIVCPGTDAHGLSYLTAYIVPKARSLSLESIKQFMSRFLPSFMIPEFFVTLRRMPLTPAGKVDRKALPRVLKE